ncbi:MAG: transglutaminase-like domain-containing protein [Bacteroidota bacterium]
MQEIVSDQMTDEQKMFAIARYCQSNIRYEQAYLSGGEFIPNAAPFVFRHRYGDCKDYSTLMVVMARIAGLHPDLALCWRGNGHPFFDGLPVALNQFNHMIVHWQTPGREYWFDGTNPPEAIGVPDEDVVNARALILHTGASSLATIAELPENLASVSGTLQVIEDDLMGALTVRLQGQYAVAFLTIRRWMNNTSMKATLTKWIEKNIASQITIADVSWAVDSTTFVINAACRFRNALWHAGGNVYVRFDKLFDKILPQEDPGLEHNDVFYYPGYARVAVAVVIPGFRSPSHDGEFRWEDRFALPPGPFDERSRSEFLRSYANEAVKAAQTIRLMKKG